MMNNFDPVWAGNNRLPRNVAFFTASFDAMTEGGGLTGLFTVATVNSEGRV